MKTYSEKLKDPRWQKHRLSVLNRDKFTCRDCGSTTEELHVHHCFYQRGNPWETPSEFLLTLCKTCHVNREELETEIKAAMGRYFAMAPAIYLEDVAEQINEMTSETGFELDPSISIMSSTRGEVESDISWFWDLEEVTGNHDIYKAIKELRKAREAKPA